MRLRAKGWRIWRLDAEMALHDAAMTGFPSGGGAQCAAATRSRRAPICTARRRSATGCGSRAAPWLWGVWLPLACLVCGLLLGPWGWAAWLIYPLQVLRQTLRNPGPTRRSGDSGFLPGAGAFPEGLGADQVPARPLAWAAGAADRVQVTADMRVAYLINQYPKVSHTFIRREILALERHGVRGHAHRAARLGRRAGGRRKTNASARALATCCATARSHCSLALLRMLLTRPVRFLHALALAWRMSRGAERPLPVHLDLSGRGLPHPAVAARGRKSARARAFRHQLGRGGDAGACARRPALELHRARAGGIRQGAAARSGREGPALQFVVAISSYGRSQLYRLVADTALAQGEGGALRAGASFLRRRAQVRRRRRDAWCASAG